MLEKVQRNVREWTWLIRYLALACLFGSVYTLLLRPVKKQVLTALRELPLRPANKLITAAGSRSGYRPPRPGGRGDPDCGVGEQSGAEEAERAERPSGGEGQERAAGASQLVQSWLREGGVE